MWFPLGVCHDFGSPLLKEIFKNSSLLQVLCQHAKGRHCTPASPSPPVGTKGTEREQRKNEPHDHQSPEEPGGARLFCVRRQKVTKFGKVRTTGHTSYVIPLLGIRTEDSFYGLSAVSRILNSHAIPPSLFWFICNICGENHRPERNYLDNFHPQSCVVFSQCSSLYLL